MSDDDRFKYDIDDVPQESSKSYREIIADPDVPFRRYALLGAYLTVQNVIMALALAFIIGLSPPLIAELYITMSMNLLAIPVVVLSDVFTFPLWVWYIIVLQWSGNLLVYKRYGE